MRKTIVFNERVGDALIVDGDLCLRFQFSTDAEARQFLDRLHRKGVSEIAK